MYTAQHTVHDTGIITVLYTASHKKLDHFSSEHNFGKHCPILIIISQLQSEIKYDQVYPKICYHSSNLLVHTTL